MKNNSSEALIKKLTKNKPGKGMRKIVIGNMYDGDLEIWTIGNLKYNIIPNMEMLKAFEHMLMEARKNPPYVVFVPPFVKFQKFKVSKKDMAIIVADKTINKTIEGEKNEKTKCL